MTNINIDDEMAINLPLPIRFKFEFSDFKELWFILTEWEIRDYFVTYIVCKTAFVLDVICRFKYDNPERSTYRFKLITNLIEWYEPGTNLIWVMTFILEYNYIAFNIITRLP